MSTEDAVVSNAPPEIQAKAEAMGWIPPTRYKGDVERFIDADAYVERGETVLPIIKENNRRLQAELDAVKRQSAETTSLLRKNMEDAEERHAVEKQKAIEQTRQAVKEQLAAANEAGDHAGVAELTDQLVKLNVPEPAPVKKAEPAPFVADPALVEWKKTNDWFGTDKRKTALALGIAQELRESGETATGADFYAKISAEMDATLGPKPTPTSKVEGARNGGMAGATGSVNGKSYASLPADARAACDLDAKRFVGESKRYKNVADWRARYVELYYQGDAA